MSRTVLGSTRTFRQYYRNFDKVLLLLVLVALAAGFLAINSATSTMSDHVRYLYRQSVACVLGLAGFFFLSAVDYEVLAKYSVFLVAGSFIILMYTALFAPNIDGNKNWIMIGSFNLQPSEITKICFILTMSQHLSALGKEMNRPLNVLLILLHFLAYVGPIVLQGDIGTVTVYTVMFLIMLICAGIKYSYLIVALVCAAAAVPVVWSLLKDYQRSRIIYGFAPELDPLDTGYQPLTSRMAIGSGQWFGMGYMNGIQSQNNMLPARHTDFIYAVIGEEFGFVGCVFVLLLLTAIVLLVFKDGVHAKNKCGFLICVAVSAMIMIQTIINIGMCIGISPVIGITLPFISYGGSSVISLIASMGLVMSVCVKPDTSLRFGAEL